MIYFKRKQRQVYEYGRPGSRETCFRLQTATVWWLHGMVSKREVLMIQGRGVLRSRILAEEVKAARTQK